MKWVKKPVDPLAASVHCASKPIHIASASTFPIAPNDESRHYHIVIHGLRPSGTVIWPRNLLDIQTMTVYVTRNSTTIEAYHTREHCPRLEKGDRKIELDKDHHLIQQLSCCNECNETVDFHRGGADGLLQKIQWLERLLGYDVDPNEYLPLSKHTLNCEKPECDVCNDVLQQYKDVITPLYVHVHSKKIRSEVTINAEC